jgi:hypothetical protein
MRKCTDQGIADERNPDKRGPEAMNTDAGRSWRFRWGEKALMNTLGNNLPGASMMPGRLFRNAPVLGPVLAWIIGMAVHDLQKPQSRIKALARRVLEKRKEPQHVRAVVVGQRAIEGPDGREMTEKTGKHHEIPGK